MSKIQAGQSAVSALVDDWQAARQELRAIEKAEHPDVTDVLGRVWVWWDGDLYRHDSMAWPKDHVTAPGVGWPTQHVLDNPNYQWCAMCKRACAHVWPDELEPETPCESCGLPYGEWSEEDDTND